MQVYGLSNRRDTDRYDGRVQSSSSVQPGDSRSSVSSGSRAWAEVAEDNKMKDEDLSMMSIAVTQKGLKMAIPKTMNTAALFAAALVELKFGKDPQVEETGVITGKEMLTNNPGPLDGELKFYHSLGSGKMNLGFNPMAIARLIMRSTKEKGNVKGEGFLQGGWILFKPDGEPVAAFQENAKTRVPIDEIVAAIKKMREEN
ncbi:hypothetical protein THAOC_03686 [Thalassiosira oceanica]|uniref:Uncharacterized protein n=1 Tax=Thalassiosira oceanica TaxID=159749 RepID=K0TBX8_THAOC|nr:hypothetical protein THAOC_03686 [Thalassiosira oceanica]|eukprot:EJK74624.1 hypothetical protein THAOC_03686 [Thalassiosira oceanica]